MELTYRVIFYLENKDEDGEDFVVTLETLVHTDVPYWDDISYEQKENEVVSFAFTNLEDVGVFIDDDLIKHVTVVLETR